MKIKKTNIAVSFAIVCAGSFVALNIIARNHARTMLHFTNTVRHRFQAMGIPSFPCAQLLVFWGGRQIGFNGFRHNPVEYAHSVSCPILFLHGTDDPRARLDEGQRVYAAIPAPKWFKAFPNVGHESYLSRYPKQWNEAVQEFLAIADLTTANNALVAHQQRAGTPPGLPAGFETDPAGNPVETAGHARPTNNNFRLDRTTPGTGDYVVLLHGMGRTARSMKKLEAHFLANGFQVVNLAYPSIRASIETLATQHLDRALASQCSQPKRKIHFVTHSLGGIVVAYYLKTHALPNLGRVVMLCPPSQGSEIADRWRNNIIYKILTGPAGQQLGTGPASVPNSLGAVNFELGVIAGDRPLNPWTSHIIPGADDGKVAVARTKTAGMQDFLVVHQSHTFIMRDHEVINQALYFITNGFFKKLVNHQPNIHAGTKPADALGQGRIKA